MTEELLDDWRPITEKLLDDDVTQQLEKLMASARQTFRICKTGFSFVLDRDSPYGAQNEK